MAPRAGRRGRPRSLFLGVVLLQAWNRRVSANNWVQTSGPKEQNIVTPSRSDFSKRWGHAVAVVKVDPEIEYTDKKIAGTYEMADKLFVIGGDDYNDEVGTGGYLNDVHYTHGFNFFTGLSQVQTDMYGKPLIKRASLVTWKSAGSLGIDGDVPYYEWIGCVLERDWGDGIGPVPCLRSQDDGQARRFLPRRNHAAVVKQVEDLDLSTPDDLFDTYLTQRVFVLGGRARLYTNLPEGWERIHGGVLPPRGSRRREYTVRGRAPDVCCMEARPPRNRRAAVDALPATLSQPPLASRLRSVHSSGEGERGGRKPACAHSCHRF